MPVEPLRKSLRRAIWSGDQSAKGADIAWVYLKGFLALAAIVVVALVVVRWAVEPTDGWLGSKTRGENLGDYVGASVGVLILLAIAASAARKA